jgi:hypothetical protein
MEDEYGRVSWWHVIDVKYDIIVQQIPPPKYLDNIRYLEDPVSSWLHELYPQYSRRYHLTSWVDIDEDNVLSPSDIIDITDENGVVTWWHVDVVTITMFIENVDNLRQKMYIELDPWLFPYWEKIKSDPISTWWHEIWPHFSSWYHLTSWFDENLDNVLGPSDIIDLTDEKEVVSWWHIVDVKYDIIVQEIPPPIEHGVEVTVEPKHAWGPPSSWLTFLVTVHNTGNVTDNYLISVVPNGWPMENILIENDRLENIAPCENKTTRLFVRIPDNAEPCTDKEIVVMATSEACGVSDNDNALIQVVSMFLHAENVVSLWDPVWSPENTQWHELYPSFSNRYRLEWWDDRNVDGILSPCDLIGIAKPGGFWVYHVKHMTLTILVSNAKAEKYLEWEGPWDRMFEDPIWTPECTQWHEVYPEFSRRYHLADWIDTDASENLSPCDNIALEDKETGEVAWYHVDNMAVDIILCGPIYYHKECMPDLGQHSSMWCWVASAANVFWWFAQENYPELLDDPLTPGLDNDYLDIIPWPTCPSPEGGFRRLLHEIAVDSLFPSVPQENENDIKPENTFCLPIDDNRYFYGLREFIEEQGAQLEVREIIDPAYPIENEVEGPIKYPNPPETEPGIEWRRPTFEDYKRELLRCEGVILVLDLRGPVNHVVTGFAFNDDPTVPGDEWIAISDPWTTGAPDHNNVKENKLYDIWGVLSSDPFVIENVQVVKMIYISPKPIPWEGTAVFWLENLYKVGLEKDLWLYQGSKLVVKFFDYMDSPENEVVIETFSPIWHLAENENVPHPSGIGVKKARLDLTTENISEVVSTIASFTATKDDLFVRIVEILGYWPEATDEEKDELFTEIVSILGQWPEAP